MYIHYINGQVEGGPVTLPYRTRSGVIGVNTPIDVLRNTHNLIPCESVDVADAADERIEVSADKTSATQYRVPQEVMRIKNLASVHGDDIADLVGILTEFGITLPIDPRLARQQMAALADTVDKLRKATTAGDILYALRYAGVSNDEIVDIAQYLQETQTP